MGMSREEMAMIRKASERKIDKFENRFGGDGSILVRSLVNSAGELNDKGRVFAHTTLNPGCSIGYHIHTGDTEIYYMYDGKAEYNDNGKIITIETGDVTFTPSGTGHGIKNIGDKPLELIALIIYS